MNAMFLFFFLEKMHYFQLNHVIFLSFLLRCPQLRIYLIRILVFHVINMEILAS